MNLRDILSIAGKPGLYKLITQSKNSLIVEAVDSGKKLPIYATHKVSALEDISVYTIEEDLPLGEVFNKILEKEDGGSCISHKSSMPELRDYMLEVLPNYDEERVYDSDLRKLFQWYNLLQSKDLLKGKEKTETKEAKKVKEVKELKEAKKVKEVKKVKKVSEDPAEEADND